jgi:SAM-dependent methyltransferase
VGCNWGRWCLSAARAGYRPIGIDPNLEAIQAAQRVAQQLGISADFVVADARHLPFRSGTFDMVFSYSVLQHFAKEDVRRCAKEFARVLKGQGTAWIQMLNRFGVRSLYHQIRRLFQPLGEFDVRYWSPGELRREFARIGLTTLSADGFFSANAQISDRALLRPWHRLVVALSEALRQASRSFPWLVYGADSLYISAVKGENA